MIEYFALPAGHVWDVAAFFETFDIWTLQGFLEIASWVESLDIDSGVSCGSGVSCDHDSFKKVSKSDETLRCITCLNRLFETCVHGSQQAWHVWGFT